MSTIKISKEDAAWPPFCDEYDDCGRYPEAVVRIGNVYIPLCGKCLLELYEKLKEIIEQPG